LKINKKDDGNNISSRNAGEKFSKNLERVNTSKQARQSLIFDAAKLWKSAPKEIEISTSLTKAKKAIKVTVKHFQFDGSIHRSNKEHLIQLIILLILF
jgi:hypothetical protein